MKALVLGLYSVTPVHPGSGSEISVIDLPIQRERHTGFPVVWGQSLKGVLRGKFREKELSANQNQELLYAESYIRAKYGEKADVDGYKRAVREGKRDPPLTEVIFGPPTGNASEHAGAIAVGDAKVLLFPVRSIKGVFAYVTCPLVLERFLEDIQRVKMLNSNDNNPSNNEEVNEIKKLLNTVQKINEALSKETLKVVVPNVTNHANVVSIGNNSTIVLEDIPLDVVDEKTLKELENISGIVKQIKSIAPSDLANSIENRLVIVSDDLFKMLVKTTTEIVTRIRINPRTGTVDTGALWYEEFLPRDTLLYSVLIASDPKVKFSVDSLKLESSEDVAGQVSGKFNGEFIQLGGDETVGKGFMLVKVYPENKG